MPQRRIGFRHAALRRRASDDLFAWDERYRKNAAPWASGGVSAEVKRFLRRHAAGKLLLDVGCGDGRDTRILAEAGFVAHGIDHSPAAIREAKSRGRRSGKRLKFEVADFFGCKPCTLFHVIYEKGVFHNLRSPKERDRFARKVSSLLAEQGLWISVCGSADGVVGKAPHGAIYLQDMVVVAELYFEVLEIVKGRYLTADAALDFPAWNCLLRRR